MDDEPKEVQQKVNITFKSGKTVTVSMLPSEFNNLRFASGEPIHFDTLSVDRAQVVMIEMLK